MECWKSTILASQVMALLTNKAQATIKVLENSYQWINPISDKIVIDSHLILNKTLKLMHPDIQMNVYAKLAKIKVIKPVDHGYNMVKWHSVMESKRIAIKLKVPGSYHESQYIIDYLDAALTIEAKTFEAEVNIICNQYLCGNPNKWNATYISGKIIKMYHNMFEDGTWKRELGKKDHIIVLSTIIAELHAKIENQSKQITAFATQAMKETTLNLDAGGKGGSTHCSKQDPYTVATWHLTKMEDKVSTNGKDYFWCTGDHWSGGTKHNGMYANHKLVIMMHGMLAWMNVALQRMEMELMVKLNQLFPPSLQTILLKSSLSMTNFAMHFALKLVFLLKPPIESGKMLRDTSRSESWVE
jgi:hypothetical protein